VVAQGASALAQVRNDSAGVVKETWKLLSGQLSGAVDGPFQYISWLNTHTQRDALILEAGCMTVNDSTAYRWLERSRFIMPECGMQMELFNRDRDFYQPAEWRQLKEIAQGKSDILDLYQSSSYWLKGKVPVYLVSWGNDPRWSDSGEIKYEDAFVSIYQLP
jgi:hypothetical protein